MLDDQQLLRRYIADGSEAAFGELVARYVNLVYSAALRRTGGDTQLAQDAAQLVFTDLARKARSLPREVVLAGWLHRATQFAAAQLLRAERRRAAREQEAVAMNALTPETTPDWNQIRPLLDQALDELGDADRDALILRFFEQRSLAEVGTALGSNEDAARKRVTRALEKLRADLIRRGITTTAATLSATISVNAVQAAPVGLAATLSITAIAGTAFTTAAVTATKTIAMTTTQKALITAALAAAIGTGIYEARQASSARAECGMLRQEQTPLVEQLGQLSRAFMNATNQLAALRSENQRFSRDSDELLRLRGQVGVLQRELATKERRSSQQSDLAKTTNTESRPPGAVITRDQISFAGYGTPESTWESWLWAEYFGTYEQALDCMTPEHRAWVLRDSKDRETLQNFQSTVGSNFNWMQIVAKKVLAEDVVELKVKSLVGEREESSIRQMRKVGGEWKFTGGSYPFEAAWDINGQIQTFVK